MNAVLAAIPTVATVAEYDNLWSRCRRNENDHYPITARTPVRRKWVLLIIAVVTVVSIGML